VQSTRSTNTQRAHENDWKLFGDWCKDAARKPLSAGEDTVALYATWLIDRGLRVSSVRRYVNSIAYLHRTAGYEAPVQEARKILEGAQRLRKERPAGKAVLGVSELRRICRAVDPGCPRQVRDHALLVFGFASALRRSNLVALDLTDITYFLIMLEQRC
jgi:site-specific recombinase XerD